MENALRLVPFDPLPELVRTLNMDDPRQRAAFVEELRRMLDDRDADAQLDSLTEAVRRLEVAKSEHSRALAELRSEIKHLRGRPGRGKAFWGATAALITAIGGALAAASDVLISAIQHLFSNR